MNTNFCIELSDESAQNISGGYYFGESSNTNITENLYINKNFYSKVDIKGQFAGAEGDAIAQGPNSAAQAITATYTGVLGSQAKSTSVSATNGYQWNKG